MREFINKSLKRDSNFEMARIIAMAFVVLGHFLMIRGLYVQDKYEFITSSDISSVTSVIVPLFLFSLCIVGVNLFVMISGYFKIRLTWKTLILYLLLCIFYNALSYCVESLYLHSFSIKGIVKIFLVSKSVNWFFSTYFWLLIISPLINASIHGMSFRSMRIIVLLLFILNCISGFVLNNQNSNGFNIIQFAFIYICGQWVRKEPLFMKAKAIHCLAFYVVFSLLTTLTAAIVLGSTSLSIRQVYAYNSPFIVLASISLFVFFTKLDFHSGTVNVFASTVVAALFIQQLLFIFPDNYYKNHVIISLAAIFAVAFVIELVRASVSYKLLEPICKRFPNLKLPVIEDRKD